MVKYYTKMLKFVLMFKLFVKLIIIIPFIYSCNNNGTDYEKTAELQYLDTLSVRLASVKDLLDKVELADIQERRDIIENNSRYCEMRYKELGVEPGQDVVRLLDEYKALGKLYENTIASYKPIVMQMEELLIQVKTLKESANDKDYNKETFKVYFNKEKEEVIALYNLANNTLGPCVETESVFSKRQEAVEELSESLKK